MRSSLVTCGVTQLVKHWLILSYSTWLEGLEKYPAHIFALQLNQVTVRAKTLVFRRRKDSLMMMSSSDESFWDCDHERGGVFSSSGEEDVWPGVQESSPRDFSYSALDPTERSSLLLLDKDILAMCVVVHVCVWWCVCGGVYTCTHACTCLWCDVCECVYVCMVCVGVVCGCVCVGESGAYPGFEVGGCW